MRSRKLLKSPLVTDDILRICPGRFLADAVLWLTLASVLSVFQLLPPIDPVTGEEAILEMDWTGGLSA